MSSIFFVLFICMVKRQGGTHSTKKMPLANLSIAKICIWGNYGSFWKGLVLTNVISQSAIILGIKSLMSVSIMKEIGNFRNNLAIS